MTRSLTWKAVLAGSALAAACFGVLRAAEAPQPERTTLYVFGTLVEITIEGAPKSASRAAMAEIGHLFQSVHRDWHAWDGGALVGLNSAIAEGQAAAIPKDLSEVLQEGQHLACLSGGLFEPAIGAVIGLWGFHGDTPTGAAPDPAQIAQIVAKHPSIAELEFDDGEAWSQNAAVQLDLGGYAKGAALDLAAQMMQARGIENAVLNAGGDVKVIGTHNDRPWRVAIRDPFVWGAVASIQLGAGEVLYTSGNYERYFEQDGQRFSHIIDPRSGWPVQEIVSVSVLGRDGALADAAATALSVAGADLWPQVAADMGVESVLMITDAGRMLVSPKMAARLEPVDDEFPAPLDIVPLPKARALGCMND
ncbi:FAD:protein FMN transferase [Donghicola sp. XS_ASV15]|uniref:FAD:protein FMN transferase n=1 Tax=Donghicola sp. XS_ASV15 TaxID=3241295 RepID=UPI0035117D66